MRLTMISFLGIGVVVAVMLAIMDELQPHYSLRFLVIWSSIGLASVSYTAWILLVLLYIVLLYLRYRML